MMIKNRRGFTLVELLAVIAIIIVMLSLAMPAVRGINSSRHLVNGGNAIVDAVNYSRQLARTGNRLTALVLIKEEVNEVDAARRYIILQQTPDLSAWKPVANWQRLPDGIIIDAAESNLFFTEQVAVQPALPTLNYGATDYTPSDYVYQIFLPNGALLLTANTDPRELLVRDANDSARTNYFNVIINPNTGSPLIRRP